MLTIPYASLTARPVQSLPAQTTLPGYKRLSLSTDGGDSWTPACPLTYDDGMPVESGSNGSTLIRSETDGRLYWLGNPCCNGVQADGNWPRTPLAIFEVHEEPFALKRDSLFIIDSAPEDDHYVQHSNFKFYQDRKTGELVIYLMRYGERGSEEKEWLSANLYEYRVSLE